MTLGEIRAELYASLGYAAAPDSSVVSRLDRYVNLTQREIITMRGTARIRRSVLTFSCLANNPFCVLPQAVVRIAGIQDRTVQKSLREVQIQDIRYGDPGLTFLTSSPDAYAIINMAAPVAVDINLAAGSKLFVVSDNAADTGATYKVYINGVTASGYPRVESLNPNGVTQVAFTSLDWLYITKLYCDLPANGNIKLVQPLDGVTYNAGTNIELGRIPIGKNAARYTRLHLSGTPSSALTYYADVDLHMDDLASAGDTSLLPEDFHWLLVAGAKRKETWKRRDWEAYNATMVEWKEGVSSLKAWCRARTDDGHSGQPQRFSQLGPYYPAGS